MFEQIFQSISNSVKELSEVDRFLSDENRTWRRLVFYAESAFYYRYYEDYINYILSNSDVQFSYITSQADDPIFQGNNQRVKPFFIKDTLAAVFKRLDCKVLVLTAPDLNNGSIKRAPGATYHVYAFHGVDSVHQAYRLGAFDYYDALLCVGQFHIDEIRRCESLNGTAPKELILTGYPFLEQINRKYLTYLQTARRDDQPVCVIAPTWAPLNPESSLMHSLIEPMLDALGTSPFHVWLRPHPELVKRNPRRMRQIEKAVACHANISIEQDLTTFEVMNQADVLITDHSSIAFDFAFGTQRPVVFMETPVRVDNPLWEQVGIEPLENAYRKKIGVCLEPSRVKELPVVLQSLIPCKAKWRSELIALRSETIANWGGAARIGAEYILSRIQGNKCA